MVNLPKTSRKLPNFGQANRCRKRLLAQLSVILQIGLLGGVIWLSIHVLTRIIGGIGATLRKIPKCIKEIVREVGKLHYLPTVVGNP